jgi:hypothetical protein
MLILWTATATAWVAAGLLVARAIRHGDGGMGERTVLPRPVSAGPVVVGPRAGGHCTLPHTAEEPDR